MTASDKEKRANGDHRNVGFLNYWTPAQIPNLLIASPVLFVSILGLYRYFTSQSSVSRSLAPLVIHHALMTFLLVFGSHTQIALRVVSTDPVCWWLLSDLAFTRKEEQGKAEWKMTQIGRGWIYWTVIWGGISIILWVGHYPPA